MIFHGSCQISKQSNGSNYKRIKRVETSAENQLKTNYGGHTVIAILGWSNNASDVVQHSSVDNDVGLANMMLIYLCMLRICLDGIAEGIQCQKEATLLHVANSNQVVGFTHFRRLTFTLLQNTNRVNIVNIYPSCSEPQAISERNMP